MLIKSLETVGATLAAVVIDFSELNFEVPFRKDAVIKLSEVTTDEGLSIEAVNPGIMSVVQEEIPTLVEDVVIPRTVVSTAAPTEESSFDAVDIPLLIDLVVAPAVNSIESKAEEGKSVLSPNIGLVGLICGITSEAFEEIVELSII